MERCNVTHYLFHIICFTLHDSVSKSIEGVSSSLKFFGLEYIIVSVEILKLVPSGVGLHLKLYQPSSKDSIVVS